MKIEYHNGWNKEKILSWLHDRTNARKTFHDPNGYTVRFADGSTWGHTYGDWQTRTPSECYINGILVQRSYD